MNPHTRLCYYSLCFEKHCSTAKFIVIILLLGTFLFLSIKYNTYRVTELSSSLVFQFNDKDQFVWIKILIFFFCRMNLYLILSLKKGFNEWRNHYLFNPGNKKKTIEKRYFSESRKLSVMLSINQKREFCRGWYFGPIKNPLHQKNPIGVEFRQNRFLRIKMCYHTQLLYRKECMTCTYSIVLFRVA